MVVILTGVMLVSQCYLTPSAGANVTQIPGIGTFSGIACPSHASCLGVGQEGSAPLNSRTGALATGQTVQNIPGVVLNSVACPSATQCLAVGETSGASAGVAVPLNPGTGAISTGATVQQFNGDLFLSVACTSPVQCLAVGFGGGRLGIAAPLDPRTGEISSGQSVQIVAGTGGAGLQGVACPRTTRCLAVGENSQSSAGVSVAINPATGAVSSGQSARDVTTKGVLFAIGCPSTAQCLAVGWAADDPAVAVPLNPTTGRISAGQHDRSIRGNGRPDYLMLDGVGCSSSTQCVAVGNSAGDPSVGDSVPLSPVSGKISLGQSVQAVSGTSTLDASVCPTAARCLAAGSFAPAGAAVVVPVKPATGTPVDQRK
jgi:hypothetical protein